MIQIFVIFSFFIWAISLIGIGSFVWFFIGKYFKYLEINNEIKLLYFAIFGLILLSVIGTVFNFFIPLSQIFSSTILFSGIILFYIRRHDIITFNNNLDILILIILSFFCGMFSLMNLANYDTGLYHLQAINWITSNALPFGLANLHGRFGFNSSWFIDASIIYPLRTITGSPFFIINTLLYFFYGTFIFLTLSKMLRKAKFSFSNFFILSTFLPWSYLLKNFSTSPSPDTPTMLLTFFITFLIIKGFENKKNDYLFMALIISFFALTIKLSAIPYFFGILFILIFIFKRSAYFNYLITSLVLFIIGIPYLIKGIVSSGCIAYPSASSCFNFKWSVPLESVIIEANWVKSWARKPEVDWHKVLGNWNWLASWSERNLIFLEIWIGLIIFGIILIIICFILKKKRDFFAFLCAFSLVLVGCIFWFLAAPDPRFGYGYLFSLLGILLSYGIYNLFINLKSSVFLLKITLIVFFFLLFFQNNLSLKQILNTKKIKTVNYTTNTTLELKTIYSPKKGDQCFDAPLPCANIFNENLKIIFDKNNTLKMFWYEK